MEKNSKKPLFLYLLSFISGVLLWLSWPPMPLTPVVFIALVPLLWVERYLTKTASHPSGQLSKVWKHALVTFLTWNLLSTYWIWFASPGGAVMAIVANSLLMSLPFLAFHRIKQVFGQRLGHISLIAFWLSFEYLHFQWELAWPWLSLGNVFALKTNWVQWYEFTGVAGGTLWIWLVNFALLALFEVALQIKSRSNLSQWNLLPSGLKAFLLVFVPIIISYFISAPEGKQLAENVVVVQPNIDPYREKFQDGHVDKQVNTLIRLSEKEIDDQTKLLIWPETALPKSHDEARPEDHFVMGQVLDFLEKYPEVTLVSGLNSYRNYAHKATPTARRGHNGGYYDVFNSAVLINNDGVQKFYHKSKMVPGVEKMPYPTVLGFLEDFAIDMGGTSGSLGSENRADVFPISDSLYIAPIICYESIFGDYVGDFVLKGANMLTIITNDGWWGDSEGYQQHLLFGRLRAIEHRRFIARSANTGVSAFITADGQLLNETPYWKEAVIKHPIVTHNELTFYSQMGDYLNRIAVLTSILLILIAISRYKLKKERF